MFSLVSSKFLAMRNITLYSQCIYIFFPNQEKILEQPSLATLDATQLKEPAIFYQASTCDHEVDTTSQDNLDFGAEINKSN